MTEKDINVTNIIINNGKVISFTFGNKDKQNKIFDLYLFISSSLDNACSSFKVDEELAKTYFDHSKITGWDAVEKCKNEVLPYLKNDVLSLKELLQKFNSIIYSKFKVNITKFVTLSHLGYNIWQKTLRPKKKEKTKGYAIEIPKDIEKYNFISKSIYGGRTVPLKQSFISKHYDEVVNGHDARRHFGGKVP